MTSSNGEKAPSKDVKESSLKSFLAKLRKRHIIETLAAFIAGGWLLIEVAERLLVGHYKFPEETIDLTVVSVIGALLATIVWRWFGGTEKRPGNVKVEVLLVPLIILVALAIDLSLILQMAGMPGKKLLIGVIAFLLGIAWAIFKLSEWAAGMPETGKKEVEVSPAALARPEKSIVVLPFVNISSEEGQDYFCDGMTEEIITDLSHVRDLLVISRSSAMTFKGTKKTIPEIAQAVNIRYVLEGSVRKAGNDLRIAAQLIDATNDAHIWAQKYSGTLNDVFDIQEKVSRSVVDALKLMLTPQENQRISARAVGDVSAYECYLKANADIFKYTEEATEQAIRYLKHALEIAGNSALLCSGLAFAHWQLANIGVSPKDNLIKAEEYVKNALALDPSFAKAHAALGWIKMLAGNQQEAVYHLKAALTANPDEVLALQGLCGVYIFAVGKTQAAIPICEKLRQIDPLDFHSHAAPGGLYFFSGQYGEALKTWRALYELYPENPYSQFFYSLISVYHKDMDKAFSIIDQNAKAHPNNIVAKLGLILKFGIQKDQNRIFNEITQSQEAFRQDPGHCYFLVISLALLGAKKEALDWFEKAVDIGFINYPMLAERDPFLANIRGEPRFKKLMERVKYEWEHFEE